MGRPRGKRTVRDDVPVKVARRVAAKIKHVAAHQGVSTAQLISEILEAPVDRAYLRMLRELDAKNQA